MMDEKRSGMEDPFATEYLRDVESRLAKLKLLAERGLAQIGDEEFFATLDPGSNPIAVLVKHLAGNLRFRWAGFPSSKENEVSGRNRDAEFVISECDTRPVLMDQWEEGWRLLFEALHRLDASDLGGTVVIRGESLSAIGAINRQLVHHAYHTGQIIFMAKHLRGGAWGNLSIPRGQSEAFTAKMRAETHPKMGEKTNEPDSR